MPTKIPTSGIDIGPYRPSKVTGLTKSTLLYNQNRHGIGTGSGLCFGDSASPTSQCNANNDNWVDTPQARELLGQFFALP